MSTSVNSSSGYTSLPTNTTDSSESQSSHLHRIPTFPLEYFAKASPDADESSIMKEIQEIDPRTLVNSDSQSKLGSEQVTVSDVTVNVVSTTTASNQTLTVSTCSSTFTIWNPRTWFGNNTLILEDIEKKMVKNIKANISRYFVNIRNNSHQIWTLAANVESKNTPIVLVHGFCGAVGLWIPNIDALSENRPMYAFDLLGFGRSSRPSFSTDPIVAETQFIESIEDWRREMKLEQFILMGHSFGGYLSVAYSLKYPQRVKALILVDPWGFPEIPSPSSKPDTQMPLWISLIRRFSQHFNPLSLFRLTGQMGVQVFKHLRPDFKRKYADLLDEPEIIYDYLYYANSFNPSGETGFRAIAEYFGFAKNPMIRRIDKVSNDIPIWFIYGSRTWVDYSAGYVSINLRHDSILTSVKLITGAGHHVYADRPSEFNEYVKYIFELIDEHDRAVANQSTNSNSSSNSLPGINIE